MGLDSHSYRRAGPTLGWLCGTYGPRPALLCVQPINSRETYWLPLLQPRMCVCPLIGQICRGLGG